MINVIPQRMRKYLGLLLLTMLLFSCIKRQPIENFTDDVNSYIVKKELLESCNIDYFKRIENGNYSAEKERYIEFLVTYMPISDFVDYDYEFFIRQVDFAILAKETFTWGDSIPEDIFMHYVLPPRVNNENMDTARMVFYRELKERLLPMNLSMEEAVLEINHWCNEKVIYRGTDERTISPLAAVISGFGRCGEESTFAVTALRSAGIPARQVYTPRWAHTDDNHAWVEVWIDGKWYFLGACEPAPVLNTGWFDIPATRTMLVHTKQFGGPSSGDGMTLSQNMNFSWINVLSTYAPIKKIKVRVVDENNIPVWMANVRYQIYNYAEMYPLFEENTDITGFSEFATGYGSVEVYVSNGSKCISTIVKPQVEGWITVVLGSRNVFPRDTCKYIPPIVGDVVKPAPELVKITERRILKNGRKRSEFEKTFYNIVNAEHFAETFGYDERIIPFLIGSRGNWPEIERFLIEASYLSNQEQAVLLLSVLFEKDLRDTKSEILSEHLEYALKCKSDNFPEEIYIQYLLNPRIEFEMLKSYRKEIANSIGDAKIAEFKKSPEKILTYIRRNVKTELSDGDKTFSVEELNNYKVPITPLAVCKFGIADQKSLQIYYVAFCRSIGVPARIDQATGLVQYWKEEQWHDVMLKEMSSGSEIKKAKVFFVSKDSLRDLKYRINFSLALFENGVFKTVDLGWETPISSFAEGVELSVGQYMLLTSLRNEDGSVIVNRKYFELGEKDVVYLSVGIPELFNEKCYLKEFVHSSLTDFNGNTIVSASLVNNSFVVFIWLDAAKEPSKHIVRDLAPMIEELSKNKITVYFIVNETNFNPEKYGFLENLNYLYDKDWTFLDSNHTCMVKGKGIDFPRIMMVNKNNEVVFSSEGYTIAVGEMLITKAK